MEQKTWIFVLSLILCAQFAFTLCHEELRKDYERIQRNEYLRTSALTLQDDTLHVK